MDFYAVSAGTQLFLIEAFALGYIMGNGSWLLVLAIFVPVARTFVLLQLYAAIRVLINHSINLLKGYNERQ
jgi:hypothetical protein